MLHSVIMTYWPTFIFRNSQKPHPALILTIYGYGLLGSYPPLCTFRMAIGPP